MDERRVRTVFEQSPDEVGEKVAKLADRRIDAHAYVGLICEQCVVQRIAHAVQPLKLVAPAADLIAEFSGEFEIDATVNALWVANCGYTGAGWLNSRRAMAKNETSVAHLRVKTGKPDIPSSCARLISASQ